MNKVFTILQLAFGVLLIVLILIQSQGAGLGSSFGGSGSFYHTKRGAEKIIFSLTVLTSVIFMALSVFSLIGN